MSELDSKLQNDDIAEELASAQQEISIAEFFEQNKQMLGFGSKTRAIVTAVKEAVDNSLDATEEAEILPDIYVKIEEHTDYYTLIIEDNGPGIPKDKVPNTFGKLLYGSRFHQRSQRRGQQGIGISAAVLYSQLTSGNPARITSKPASKEKGYYVELGIDTDTNNPKIVKEDNIDWGEKQHGTKIELDLEANMRARKQLHQYITMTAVVNPHAIIELHEPENKLIFDERVVEELPDKVEEIQPHPHGIELGTLQDMLDLTDCRQLNNFLQTEFTRVGPTTSENIINNFKDRLYGKELSWPLLVNGENIEDKYKQIITDSIKRKGQEATEEVTNNFISNLKSYDKVSKGELYDIINESIEESNTEKTFGETVKENIVESFWNRLLIDVDHHIMELVDNVTISRKSNELVEKVGENLAKEFSNNNLYTIAKYDELKSIISEASDKSTKEVDTKSSFGDTAQEKVFTEIWSNTKTVQKDIPKLSNIKKSTDKCRFLLEALHNTKVMAPPSKCLSPIKEDKILAGMKSQYNADFYTSETRDAGVANGEPFIIEAGIAYGGDIEPEGKVELSRFANRVPLVYQEGACSVTKVVKNIRWNSYYTSKDKISQTKNSLPVGPMVLLVHVASTNVPFTSESKDAIASVPEIEDEVEKAVRSVARDLKNFMSKERSRRKRKQKRNIIGDILEEMTGKLENVTGREIESKTESQARILNNVYVNQKSKTKIKLHNFGSRKRTVVIKAKFEDIPSELPENVELVDNNYFEHTLEIQSDESGIVSYSSSISDMEIIEPETPKVTIEKY